MPKTLEALLNARSAQGMRDVVITNPVINSLYDESGRHFRFGNQGITEDIVAGRRVEDVPNPGA